MENTLNDQIKNNVKACVICSTQNQMVNYIPIKYFGFDKVYNITIPIDQKEEKNHNKNNTWDRCLKTVLNGTKIIDVTIEQASITNIESIKDVIIPEIIEKEEEEGNSIFWNVTGGQRPLLMAINDLIKDRKVDYICYLEGNSNEMVILKDGKPQKQDDKNPIFELKGLTINQALQLASFEALKEANIDNLLTITDKVTEYNDYIRFYNLLCPKNGDKRTIDSNLRKQCIESNKKVISFEEIPSSIKEELEKEKKGAFGKPFELMVAYKILEELKKQSLTDNIAELAVSYKTKQSKDNINKDFTGNKNIDEFDVALLTKQGKFVIFECKSGSMSGDNAKSHKYSTYAVGGVYGMPILVVPLTSDEMSSKETLDTLSKDSEDVKYIISAVNSAKRANLEVWGIDEIGKRLKDLLQIQ